MSLNPFRSFGSRRSALATAAVIGAGALFANFPAAAEQLGAKGSPACSQLAARTDQTHSSKDFKNEMNCEMREVDKRIDAANQRGAEADRIGTAAEKQTACSRSLEAWIKGEDRPNPPELVSKNIAAVKMVLGGQSIRDADTCSVLGKLKQLKTRPSSLINN